MKQLLAAVCSFCVVPALLGATPDATQNNAGTPPMSIGDCHLDYSPGGILPLSKTVGPLHITFTNETKQPIVEAKFDVNLDGNHVEVKDVGSYAPDVEIKKLYRQLGGGEHFLFSREPQPTCSIAMAKFADGTVWTAPAAGAAAAATATPAASASPAASSFDQLVGSWNCASAAGSTVTMSFTAHSDGTFVAHTEWKNGTARGIFEHVFTPKPDGSWKTSQVDGTKAVTFDGSSAGFDGDAIAFSGTEHANGSALPERESFRFTSPTVFEHTWYKANAGGVWEPTSFTECTKV